MSLKPAMIERAAQPYIAIREHLLRESLGDVAPGLLSEVCEWLATNKIAVAGPPLIRYLIVDYNSGEVEVDVGVPVASMVPGHLRVHWGEIPGGTYATVVHQGSYANLMDTTAKLLAWGKENNIQWQVDEAAKVTNWRGRIEHYLVGPPDNPNPQDWRTEIAILLAEREDKNESADA
jgi:effector-binding domain-containing protein